MYTYKTHVDNLAGQGRLAQLFSLIFVGLTSRSSVKSYRMLA